MSFKNPSVKPKVTGNKDLELTRKALLKPQEWNTFTMTSHSKKH